MGLDAAAEGLPHVHHDVGDLLGARLPKPPPELPEIFLLPPLAHEEDFRPAGAIQGVHQVPVRLAASHGDLVDAQGGDPVQGAGRLGRLDGALIQHLHGPGVEPQEHGHRTVRQDLADLPARAASFPVTRA